jgi:hypothetical protein
MPRKQQPTKSTAAAPRRRKQQPAKAAKRGPLAELTAAQQLSHVAELTATMEQHEEGYRAYERAHHAMRAGKLAATKAAKVKAANRDAHRIYWSAYERRRALRKLMAAEAQGA